MLSIIIDNKKTMNHLPIANTTINTEQSIIFFNSGINIITRLF